MKKYFLGGYNINLVTGEVMFGMDRLLLIREDFVASKDMDAELAEYTMALLKPDNFLECMNDGEFIKYFSAKFLPLLLIMLDVWRSLCWLICVKIVIIKDLIG